MSRFTPVYIFELLKDLDSPKPAFIREVLVKCRRLCYHQRIVETVPQAGFEIHVHQNFSQVESNRNFEPWRQDFEPLLPNEPNIRFKYRHDEDDEMSENPAAACSRKLEYAFRSKDRFLKTLRECFFRSLGPFSQCLNAFFSTNVLKGIQRRSK